jgi:hypothetical protein
MLDRSLIPRARVAIPLAGMATPYAETAVRGAGLAVRRAGSVFRHLALAIPLAAAALFTGCGLDPQAGGGTELPGPIRVYVFVDSSASTQNPQIASRILASQWRLWDVRSQTIDSTTLESRGLLTDSSGIITLPPDSGTFLVEAWTDTDAPDSVDISVKLANADLPDPNCVNVVHTGTAPNSIRGCTSSKGTSPSAISRLGDSKLPDVLTMVRIPGKPTHRFRIIGTLGDTLPLREARLWKWSGNQLSFRGILKQTSSVDPELPTLSSNDSFLVEAWKTSDAGPVRISTRHTLTDATVSGLAACTTPFTDPLPGTLTMHQCRFATPNPSGGPVSPDFSAVMEYVRGQ